MKNIVFSVILMFFLAMTSAFALGEYVDINTTEVYFSADHDVHTSKSVIVSEDGELPLVNKINETYTLKFLNAELTHESDSDYKINITGQTFTLGPLANSNVEIRVKSIKDVEAGIYNGVLTLLNDSNSAVLDNVNIKVLVPAIEVKSIEIIDKETGFKDTKLEKGQEFIVKVEYENVAEESHLTNVNVVVGIYEGNDDKLITLIEDVEGDELEEDEDVSDMKDGKIDTVEFKFKMPYDISDEDEFTVFAEIYADAEETSSIFYARDTQEFSSVVKDNEVKITRAIASPLTLACGSNKIRLVVELTNVGDEEEEVQLFLRNDAIAFDEMLNNKELIELGDDFTDEDDFTESIEQYVILEGLKEGENTFSVIAYYEDGLSTASKDIVITSQSCGTTVDDTVVTDDSDIIVDVTDDTVTDATTSTTPTSYVTLKDVSGPSLDSGWIIPVIIGVGGLIVGIIVALLVIPKP